jgi:hypothetical protein
VIVHHVTYAVDYATLFAFQPTECSVSAQLSRAIAHCMDEAVPAEPELGKKMRRMCRLAVTILA